MRFFKRDDFLWRDKGVQLLILLALCAAAVICWNFGAAHQRGSVPAVDAWELGKDTDTVVEEIAPRLAVTQTDTDVDSRGAVRIDLSSEAEEFTITEGGNYCLTGNLDGRLRIATSKEKFVHLFLDGVTVNAPNGPALYVESASKVVITVLPDTENVFSDFGDYKDWPDVEACIYSTCDLTINGSGAMTVHGYYEDAVRSRDVLKILDGDLTIKCKRTAIHGTDGIHVTGGTLRISTEKNGFKTTKTGVDGRGDMIISGGNHTIIAGRYAFICERGDLYIYNCKINQKSVVDTFKVGGLRRIQSGCVNE